MSNFHQDLLLQSKKKVSGEIFKEPFLDILLTDLEQSSFSLICEDSILNTKTLAFKKTPLLRLRTNNYLFEETACMSFGSDKIKSSILREQSINKNKGPQIPTKNNKVSYVFNPSTNSYFIKPFLIGLPSILSSKLNKKSENSGHCIFVSTLPKRSSYLCSARAHTPSRSRGKSFENYFQQEGKQVSSFSSSSKTNKAIQKTSFFVLANSGIFYKNFVCIDAFLTKNKECACLLKTGDYVYCGDRMGYLSDLDILKKNTQTKTPLIIGESGKVLKISQTQVTVQKVQPVLFYSQAEIHVESNEWVKRGTPILTLTHQTLVTGDIVQGIPRIEQLFEASTAAPPGAALQDFGSPSDDDSLNRLKIKNYFRSNNSSHLLPPTSSFMGTLRDKNVFEQHLSQTTNLYSTVQEKEEKTMFLYNTLQSQVREIFRKKWDQYPLPVAVRQSLEEIQQVIVESIQKVYISQGVLIADKHIEIIVRQMTSKAQVFDGGSTGLLIDEILSLQQIENANISTPGQKALYFPVIMGLTRSALSSDSFVSAASFQETTRVLSRDAIAGKTDFLRGLKEKVIIGDLIDAGTGLDAFYIYSLFSKKIFENKYREILNRKVTHKTLKKLVLRVTDPKTSNV